MYSVHFHQYIVNACMPSWITISSNKNWETAMLSTHAQYLTLTVFVTFTNYSSMQKNPCLFEDFDSTTFNAHIYIYIYIYIYI